MLIWTSIQKLKQKSNFLLNSGPSPFFNSCSKFSSKKTHPSHISNSWREHPGCRENKYSSLETKLNTRMSIFLSN